MKITVENTDKILHLQAGGGEVPARVWEGETENGTKVICFVTRLLVKEGQPEEVYKQFERELKETPKAASRAVQTFPLRLFLD